MNKVLKRIVFTGTLAIIAYLTMTGIDAFKHATAETSLFKRVGDVVYYMRNPINTMSGGTGFLVKASSGKSYLLTNRHVCGLASEGYIRADSIRGGYDVKVVKANEGEADLCLTEAPPFVFGKPLKLAGDVGYGERIYLIGHPLLHPMTVKTGFIVEESMIQINECTSLEQMILRPDCIRTMSVQVATVDSRGGNSGSPVTNVDGDVVGVLFAGDDQGLSALVPLTYVKEFLAGF